MVRCAQVKHSFTFHEIGATRIFERSRRMMNNAGGCHRLSQDEFRGCRLRFYCVGKLRLCLRVFRDYCERLFTTARLRRNQGSIPYFTTEAQSSQSSEYFLIKNSLLRDLSASALQVVADQPKADPRCNFRVLAMR